MTTQQNIETESARLYFRKVDLSHCTQTYVNWLNDPEVNLYLESGRTTQTLQDLENFINGLQNRNDVVFWAIHLKENNKHIGNVKIDSINKMHQRGEYGIMMGDKTEWGKGYAKEASQAIMDFCFEKFKLRKITLGVVEDNVAAVKLYQNLGYIQEGLYKSHGFYNGKWCNMLRMAKFSPEVKL